MNAERLIGLAYVCERFHGGQSSRGYRLLSRINWRPGTGDEWEEARAWAAHYTRMARRRPQAF